MTLCVAWVKKVHNCQELILMSDSRLSGGERWDQCPKIMTMERDDCAICFAGETFYAYPLMIQVRYAVNHFNQVKSRAMPIENLNGYLLQIINHLCKSIKNDCKGNVDDYLVGNRFIFGGYSWIDKCFKAWNYNYDKDKNKFLKYPKIVKDSNKLISIIGDHNEMGEFKKNLNTLLIQKYGTTDIDTFDMEPFEVFRDMLRSLIGQSNNGSSIGGAPQIIKIYQYQNSRPLGVYWPLKDKNNIFKNRTLLGRELFDFENSDYWFIDPDTLLTNGCNYVQK